MVASRKKATGVSAIFLAISIALLHGCGSGPGSDGLEGKSSVSLQLNWPEGYSFDSSASQLNFISSPTMMAAPDYVTSCKVTISGDDMSSVTLDVPLSTGEVSGSVTPGERRFDAVVDTNMGLSFTGSTTATLVPGNNGSISVTLYVNSPPELGGITVSVSSPKKRETVRLSVSVTDLNTADAQNITWDGGGGRISGSGSSVTWVTDRSGVYTVTVTVDDGRGGVVGGSAVITVINTPPVISSITADKTSAVVGDTVNATCAATDADGDPLSYSWLDGYGWSATGASAQYKVTSIQVSALTCVVDDGDTNGKVSGPVGITVTSGVTPPAAPTGVTATAGDAQVTITWPPVAGAASYNLYWSDASPVTTANAKIAGVTSPYVHTGRVNGTTYHYAVTAVNSAGESALSAEVGATPQNPPPGTPTGVSATGGAGQVTVSWSPVSGVTSYNVYWSFTPGVTTTTGTKIAGVTSPYTHTGLADATAHYYVVTALGGGGESAASAEVSATTYQPVSVTVPAP